MKIYIYALKEIGKPFNKIRWVGQTQNPKSRLVSHKGCYPTTNNNHKIYWILSVNKKIEMITLEITNHKLADKKEAFWIKKLKSMNYPLLNIKPGEKLLGDINKAPSLI